MEHAKLEDFLDPDKRDEVVMAYRAAGMGKERYGVVCPNKDCYKRICLQGWSFANENPEEYCLCRENYVDNVEDITSVLKEHGLPWRPLKTKVKMKEATRKKRKKKGPRVDTIIEREINVENT